VNGDRVLVLGAGLAGLSTALHLEGRRAVTVLEREDRVGGMTRSFKVNGFVFDVTGHLLHLRRPPIRRLVARLLPDGMASVERRSFIYSHGVYTDYPFQANLHGLPPEVVRDCLLGFIAAHHDPERPSREALAEASFHDWARATFGAGITRHFLFPYNRKLWCRDLEEITADWVSWSVPRPALEEVVGGALGLKNRGLGYNPRFLYPRAGGIEVLPEALAGGLRQADVQLRTTVAGIDVHRRQLCCAEGRQWGYVDLVSTLPLPKLLALVDDLPEPLRQAGEGLAATQVLNVNLGIARAGVTDRHWIYFPEDRYLFYRVGSPTAFCPASAPAGCSSLYVEVARNRIRSGDVPGLVRRVKDDLLACGLLRDDDRIVAEQTVVVDPAYVVFDRHRRRVLPEILSWLEERGIRSIGRYGSWEYGSMEDAIHQGMEAADQLASGRCRDPVAVEDSLEEPWPRSPVSG
jgi:protoporphyrinogen oxidase